MGSNEVAIFMCGGVGGVLGLFIGAIVLVRWIAYRETIALAEKGLVRPRKLPRLNGKRTLRWGIVIGALGFALTLGLWPLGLRSMKYVLGFGPWMLFGLIPLFFGISLVLVYVLADKDEIEHKAAEEDQFAELAVGGPVETFGEDEEETDAPAEEAAEE